MDDALFCKQCNACTIVVFDHARGDVICTECGLVLESHCVDETPEWRSFGDDCKDNDPTRVGEASALTSLLDGAGVLSTVISDKDALPRNCLQFHAAKPHQSTTLLEGFDAISNMVDRLGPGASVTFRASEIYKKVDEQKSCRGRNRDAVLAACVYVACLQENKGRTIKEICSVANGITMKDFLRAKKHLVKQLEAEIGHVDMGTVHTEDTLRRFGYSLGMSNQSLKAAQEAVQNIRSSDTIDVRRNPISVAAAILYMITQLATDMKPTTLHDISIATKAAESTIKSAYNDIYPHVSAIIPSWFAKTEDLSKLCSPRKGG